MTLHSLLQNWIFWLCSLVRIVLANSSATLLYLIIGIFTTDLPPSLNFLSITGDYMEGGMLTASYGYIGGHEGKSIYKWYLHEVNLLLLVGGTPLVFVEVSYSVW